jgi:hypothetical protein
MLCTQCSPIDLTSLQRAAYARPVLCTEWLGSRLLSVAVCSSASQVIKSVIFTSYGCEHKHDTQTSVLGGRKTE